MEWVILFRLSFYYSTPDKNEFATKNLGGFKDLPILLFSRDSLMELLHPKGLWRKSLTERLSKWFI